MLVIHQFQFFKIFCVTLHFAFNLKLYFQLHLVHAALFANILEFTQTEMKYSSDVVILYRPTSVRAIATADEPADTFYMCSYILL